MLFLSFEGILHVWLDSPFAMVPAVGLMLLTIEPRIRETVSDSNIWNVIYRLIPAELVHFDGIYPYLSIDWYVGLALLILFGTGFLFWLRDG